MSKLYFRYSAMNSGKTTNLLQVAYNYEERGMGVLLAKPYIDRKGDDKVVSRLGVDRKVDLLIKPDDNIIDLFWNKYLHSENKIGCFLIDEVQFLSREQIDQLMRISIKFNIPVICYGLRTDFKTEGFEGSTRLLQIAHSIEEMKTICRCGRKAILNARFVDGEFMVYGDKVYIDNDSKVEYESMCAKCYYDNVKNTNLKAFKKEK